MRPSGSGIIQLLYNYSNRRPFLYWTSKLIRRLARSSRRSTWDLPQYNLINRRDRWKENCENLIMQYLRAITLMKSASCFYMIALRMLALWNWWKIIYTYIFNVRLERHVISIFILCCMIYLITGFLVQKYFVHSLRNVASGIKYDAANYYISLIRLFRATKPRAREWISSFVYIESILVLPTEWTAKWHSIGMPFNPRSIPR